MSTIARDEPPAPAAIRPFHLPSLERSSLDNGLNLISARHGPMPLVTAALVLEGGASQEPASRAGLATLTGRALETGTARRSGDRLAIELERLGVEFDADVSWDAVVLSLTVARERLEAALALFAEIAREPAFPPHEIERVRDQQMAEILQRRTEPRALAGEATARFIFSSDSTYARPINGMEETVRQLTRDHTESFYHQQYRSSPATLVLAGDIDAAEVRALGNRFFGDWAAAEAPRASLKSRPAVSSSTVFLVDRPGSVQSELRLGHVGVERTHPDFFPLLVMNALLGGTFTSRLNMTLRERLGFTYGASSRFAWRRAPGPFVIQTAVGTEVTARAVQETLREIRMLQDDGASNEEVGAARDFLAGTLPLQFQTTEQLAARLAELAVYGLEDDFYQRYRDHVAAVTSEDMQRVARQYLHPEAMAIVVVGAATELEKPLLELGTGPVLKFGSDLMPCT
jgi:zinc protease